MAKTSDKTVKFVAKLVQLTQDGRCNWTAEGSATGGGANLTASIDGASLRIYQNSEVVENPLWMYVHRDELQDSLSSNYVTLSPSINVWNRRVLSPKIKEDVPATIVRKDIVLEVLKDGIPVYRFTDVTGLSDLYDSAAFSAAKVGDLMDAVLSKE
jgi:hypothetical protein